MEEIWKDILGYEGKYQASNLGGIKSLNYNKTGKNKVMKSSISKTGYFFITLCDNGNKNNYLTHRLIAITFLKNIEDKSDVNHINGIRNDNRLENLEWCTRSENELHKYHTLNRKHNLYGKFGKEHNRSKEINQYDLEGNFIKTWGSIIEASEKLLINSSNISSCCSGRYKTAKGYIFKYVQ